MKEKLENILTALKVAGFPVSKIETELGFSNGLLGKAKNGVANLSDEKFVLLEDFFKKHVPTPETISDKIDHPNNMGKEAAEKNGHTVPIPAPKKAGLIGVDAEKRKKLLAVMDGINKDYGAGSLMIMGETPTVPVEVISTGSLGIDAALGVGGLPKGRIIEIYGPESSGKTTIALHVIAEAQKLGGMCGFVDAEHAFDPTYAEKLGVKVDNLFLSQPSSGEQALEIADRIIVSGSMDVVVIDSVAALVPKSELEGEMGDSKMGLHARLMGQAMRKMVGSIAKTKTILIFINQLRDMIGNTWGGPTETTTGGKALKFYASVRLDVRRIQTIKDGEVATGNRVKVKVVKNKVAPPFKTAEFDIVYGQGINHVGEVIDAAVAKNIIQKSGSWYAYDQNKLGQGRDSVIALLKDHEELLNEIKNKL